MSSKTHDECIASFLPGQAVYREGSWYLSKHAKDGNVKRESQFPCFHFKASGQSVFFLTLLLALHSGGKVSHYARAKNGHEIAWMMMTKCAREKEVKCEAICQTQKHCFKSVIFFIALVTCSYLEPCWICILSTNDITNLKWRSCRHRKVLKYVLRNCLWFVLTSSKTSIVETVPWKCWKFFWGQSSPSVKHQSGQILFDFQGRFRALWILLLTERVSWPEDSRTNWCFYWRIGPRLLRKFK